MRVTILVLAWILVNSAFLAQASSVFLPSGMQQTEGNSHVIDPFGASEPSRVQQLYGASEFGAIGGSGALITEIRFRSDAEISFAGAVIVPELEISMSTSLRVPSDLRPVWQDNIGSDETIVFPKGPIQFTYTVDRTHVNSMSVVIPLPKPFYYQPANGNLLLDIKVLQKPQVGAGLVRLVLDAEAGPSRVTQYSIVIGSPFAINGSVAPYALITQFEFAPVPEPGSLACVAIAMLGVAAIRNGRKNFGH